MGAKTLLAYVSAGGATESYAKTIAEALTSRGHDVHVVNLKRERVADLASYDAVVVGTGVRMGMVYRAAKKLLAGKELKDKRLAVFLSSGLAIGDREKSKEKFLGPIMRKYGLSPVMYDAFPGKMPGPAGKVEDTTDMEAARRWAEELAQKLG